MALDAEHAGLVVELLGGVFADALERAAARAGGARRLVADLAAQQVLGQLRTLGLALLTLGRRLGRQLLEFALQRLQVGIDRLFEQALLLGVEVLAPGGELQPLEHRHLVRDPVDRGLLERDLAVAALDLGVLHGKLIHQRAHDLAQLLRIQGLELCFVDHEA